MNNWYVVQKANYVSKYFWETDRYQAVKYKIYNSTTVWFFKSYICYGQLDNSDII